MCVSFRTGRNSFTFCGVKRRLTATQKARQIARQQRLRQEAVDAVRTSKRKRARGERFDTLDKIAKDHNVTRQTLHAWVRAADKAGGAPPAPRRAGRPPRWAGQHDDVVRDLHRHLLAQPPEERTTAALASWFYSRTGVHYAESSLRRLLWRLGCDFALSAAPGGVWGGQRALADASVTSAAPSGSDMPPSPLGDATGASVTTRRTTVPPTTIPDWLTVVRQRRILELVRSGVAPRHVVPITVDTVLDQLRTMARAMNELGATKNDLLALLPLIGVAHDPNSGALCVIGAHAP